MLQICQNIRQARLSKELSQQKVAENMGLDRDTYKNWEGNTEPDLATIKTIAKAIGVPAHTLLAGIIEFAEEEEMPDFKTDISITGHQLQQLRFSLGILEKVFGHGQDLKKDIAPDPTKVLSGKRKTQASTKAKGKQKGIST